MATIKNLLIRLGMHTEEVDRGVDRATRSLEKVARQANALERDLRSLSSRFDGVGSAASRITSGIASFTGSLASAGVSLVSGTAKLAALASALSLAGSSALSLASALAPVGGALAALPGLALAGAAAFGVWKLATGGLGEAMGAALSGNVDALAKALGKLSERGRDFINEFSATIPMLQGFKAAAQDSFLAPIAGQLGRWLSAADALKPAIAGLAGEFGGMVRAALDFATAERSIGQFNAIISNTRSLFAAVRDSAAPLLKGFVDLGTVGSSWLASLNGGLQNGLTRFGEWMSRIAESGQAWKWMDGALVALKQVFAILGDVFGIITGVFRAIQSNGQGALGVLGSVLDGLHKFVDSARGQETLRAVFAALFTIGQALVPVITTLAGALAGIAPTVGQIAQLIGPILTTAITALAPALQALGPGIVAVFTQLGIAVQTLASSGALTQLATAITSILIALTPLLPALATLLVPLLQHLTTLVTTMVAPALSTLVGWIQQAVNWLTGAGLAQDSWLMRTFQALQDKAMPIAQTVFALIEKIFNDVSAWVLENRATFEEWGDRLASIFNSVADIVAGVWQAISIAWNMFGGPLLDLVGGVFSGILQVIDGVMQAIKGLVNIVLGVITGDWERAWGGVKDFFGGIWEAIKGILSAAWEIIKFQMSAPLAALGQSWDSFWNRLKQVVSTVWDAIAGWVSDRIADVKSFIGRLADLPGQVGGWFGQVRQSIVNTLSQALDFVRSIPSRITGALGNMGNLLYNTGRDLVLGFWNGIVSLWNWLVSQVQNLFGGLAGWAKSILGIASPSKVFADIGKQIPAGMALGIERSAGMVSKAVAGLATSATVAVGGISAPAYAATPARAGGAGNTFYITNNVSPTANPADVGAAVVEAIQEFERRSGAGWRS